MHLHPVACSACFLGASMDVKHQLIPDFFCQVFNEVVVDRGQSPYLCNIDLYVEGKLVTTVQGDGQCFF